MSRRRRYILVFEIASLAILTFLISRVRMSESGNETASTNSVEERNDLALELQRTVQHLAGTIGERNLDTEPALTRSAEWIAEQLSTYGYEVRWQRIERGGYRYANLEATQRGSTKSKEIVVVGAHYDSVTGSTGADDNASGVAATLALARRAHERSSPRTVRFVFFANEEPPYFLTELMGSVAYAQECRKRNDDIVAMMSLETIGYYSDARSSQNYPAGLGMLFPSTGNFIAFVSNTSSRPLLKRAMKTYGEHSAVPAEGGALPEAIPGVGWSDQWSFWREGYPAMMITDTAPFRNPNYHTLRDTPDTLDYERLAEVTLGLEHVVRDLASK